MEKQRIRISQCMIVKNEEMNIERALSWGKGIVWEQIVVDTGSTDRTEELAEAMGAKVCHFEWIDDFAAAKNFAISKASGDWIALLDADEYLTEEWSGKLIPLLEKLEESDCLAIRSPCVCVDDDGNFTSVSRHCRLFRRKQGLGYKGAIHEVLALNGQPLSTEGVLDTGAEFPVYHTGYRPKEMEEKQKTQRNVRILKKELQQRPNDYNVMGYLGDACRSMKASGDGTGTATADRTEAGPEEAVRWYQSAVAGMPTTISVTDERSAATFIYLLELLSSQKREAEFLDTYKTAIEKIPWVYDCDYLAGGFWLEKKDYRKTVYHLERALQIAQSYGADAYGVYMTGNIAGVWEQLAWCCYELKDLPACIRYSTTLLKADNRRIMALTLFLKALQSENPEAVVSLLCQLYDVRQSSDRIFLLKGAIRAEAWGVLNALRQECTPEECAFLDKLLTIQSHADL